MGTLKPQNNRPLYRIGTLAVDGWAVTFGTARRGLGVLRSRSGPPRCTKFNVKAIHQRPVYQIHYYSMWQCLSTYNVTAVGKVALVNAVKRKKTT